jgi:phosphoribosylformylglycinamidine synthase
LLGGREAAAEDLAGSEYIELRYGIVAGRPSIDLALEKRVQRCCLEAIKQGIIKSAHDCSEGGLSIALAESCISGSIGFSGPEWVGGETTAAALFGEAPSRIVVSVSSTNEKRLRDICRRFQVPIAKLGTVGGKKFTLGKYLSAPLKEIESVWKGGLE